MAYLVRLRRLQLHAASTTDKAMWTAADYSVMITGLNKREIAHKEDDCVGTISVETKLLNDLIKLGFKREWINHIELGVYCAEEISIGHKVCPYPRPPFPLPTPRPKLSSHTSCPSNLTPPTRKVERLKVSKEELQVREEIRKARRGPADEEEEKTNQIDKQLEELNEELKALQMKEHHTTGHVRDRSARMSPCRPHTIPALVAGVMRADRTVAATGFHRLPV